jgi:hypothetical protein
MANDLKYTEWMLIVDFFPESQMGCPRKMGNMANYECHSLWSPNWLPMADIAERLCPVANRIRLFSMLEAIRIMGAHQWNNET